MSNPTWRDSGPNGPYGGEPGSGPRARDSRAPAGDPRAPRDPRGDGGPGGRTVPGGQWGDPRGDRRGPRKPGDEAATRRMPAQAGVTQPITSQPIGTSANPVSRADYGTRPSGQPRGIRRAGSGGARRRGTGGRPRGAAQPWSLLWRGSLRGGLAICVILGSAAIGAIATVVTKAEPGSALGLFVLVGTVAAALAVEPRAGRVLFPVPALAYVAAALGAGVADDRTADSSKTALAVGATQWIASGFLVMVLATVLAVVLTAVRWYLWRRDQPAPAGGPRERGDVRGSRADGWGNRADAWGTQGNGGGTGGSRRPGDPRSQGTQPRTMPVARPADQWTQGPAGTRGTPASPGAQGRDQRPEQGPGPRPSPKPGSGLAPYTRPGSGPYDLTPERAGLTP
jgi:hypothetical protein